jgi:hypothetical protein
MKEYHVKSFNDLHAVLGNHRRDAGWMYRGHSDEDWPLVPRAGREPFNNGYDEIFFRRWKSEANQYIEDRVENDWEWLALAQHHGFATRLLDWTMKPLAAAYFAVVEPGPGDAVVYAFKTRKAVQATTEQSPFQQPGVAQYIPRRVSHRVSRQIGWFTIHGPPSLSIEDGMGKEGVLERILIDAGYREELVFELNQYGVNSQTLFPNLVGLSRHFNWVSMSFDYWAEGLTSAYKR